MKANGRRYRRYRIGMPVELSIGKNKLFLKTADIGMSGVFVCTDARPKDGEFVRIAIDLPFGGDRVELLGRVTSVRNAGDAARSPGCGVAFYGNGPTERDAWHRFVREIERRHPEASEKDVVLGSAEAEAVVARAAADPWPLERPPSLPRRRSTAKADAVKTEPATSERRRYQRFEVLVEVKAYFESIEDLVSMHTRDLSRGGMFIATTTVTAEGARLLLRIVHPKTNDEFPIPCIVRRCTSQGDERGLAVEFQLDETGRNEFWTFIGGVVVVRAETKGRTVNYF